MRTDPHHRAHGSTRCPRARAGGRPRRPPTTDIYPPAQLSRRCSSPFSQRRQLFSPTSSVNASEAFDLSTSPRPRRPSGPLPTDGNRVGPRWAERQEPKTPALDASDLHDAWHGPLDEAWKGLRDAPSGYRGRRGPPDWPQEEERSSATTPSVKRRPRRPARGRGPSAGNDARQRELGWTRRTAEDLDGQLAYI